MYVANVIKNPTEIFETIRNETRWVQVPLRPRAEYWSNDYDRDYAYGKEGPGRVTYKAQPWIPAMKEIRDFISTTTDYYLEGCFANYYKDSSDNLGWHADNDPGIDHDKPIAIVSLGAEREIWFRRNGEKGTTHTSQLLGNGSLYMMSPGFQFSHQHRIPRASRQDIGPRISLTFRGLIK